MTSLTPSTHVAGLSSHTRAGIRKSVGYHFCVETRAGGRTIRNTLFGPTSQNFTQILPAPPIQSVAADITTSNVIAAMPLPGSVTARTFERSGPNAAAARVLAAVIPRRGNRLSGFINSCRRLAVSSFRTLIKPLQKSLSVLGILLCPSLLLLTVHAPKHERSFLKCLTNVLKGQSKCL